jgi:hypothetical protein
LHDSKLAVAKLLLPKTSISSPEYFAELITQPSKIKRIR